VIAMPASKNKERPVVVHVDKETITTNNINGGKLKYRFIMSLKDTISLCFN
jgi:hypothetical protein